MDLIRYGYGPSVEKLSIANGLADFETGRVIAAFRERYAVATRQGEMEAEVTGNLRFGASSREDFPAVGDWVSILIHGNELAIIHKILPRFSKLVRQAVGKQADIQVIAANIDYAFLMQAADRDFNLNRLERYLTLCYSGGVKPVIVLTKTDLAGSSRTEEIKRMTGSRIPDVPILAISNLTHEGFGTLLSSLEKGRTYCMLGSSGVGKSTLLNNLSGKSVMKTGQISGSTGKGKHVTSHRELIVLENGAILIDNPGMKEVGIADQAAGLEQTFGSIISLAGKCRYSDCTHTGEKGCAVIEAVESGLIDRDAWNNFLKMEKEKEHFTMTTEERKRKDRIFGKILKDYYKRDVKQKRK